MRVIEPIAITPDSGILISSTVGEPSAGEAAWSAGTTYTAGQRVARPTVHKVFQAIENPSANLNKVPEISPTFWLEVGPTNKWAMFDGTNSTSTTTTSDLTVVIAPGYANALRLRGLVGEQLQVTVTNGAGGPVVYSHTRSLITRDVFNWYDYYTAPFTQLAEVNLLNLLPRQNARVTVSITGSGAVGCSDLVLGTSTDWGAAKYGLRAPLVGYSRIIVDDFGNKVLLPGLSTRDLNVSFWVPHAQMAQRMAQAARLQGKVAVWIGADGDDLAWTTTHGVLTSFEPSIEQARETLCTASIEGFI